MSYLDLSHKERYNVFLLDKAHSYSTSLHQGVQVGTSKLLGTSVNDAW